MSLEPRPPSSAAAADPAGGSSSLRGRAFDERFEVSGLVGADGRGELWRVRDRRAPGRRLLLRWLRVAQGTGELLERLQDWARAFPAGTPTAAPEVIAVGATPEGIWIVRRLARGRELRAVLDAGRALTEEQRLRVLDQLLAALEHAHARGFPAGPFDERELALDLDPADTRIAWPELGLERLLRQPDEPPRESMAADLERMAFFALHLRTGARVEGPVQARSVTSTSWMPPAWRRFLEHALSPGFADASTMRTAVRELRRASSLRPTRDRMAWVRAISVAVIATAGVAWSLRPSPKAPMIGTASGAVNAGAEPAAATPGIETRAPATQEPTPEKRLAALAAQQVIDREELVRTAAALRDERLLRLTTDEDLAAARAELDEATSERLRLEVKLKAEELLSGTRGSELEELRTRISELEASEAQARRTLEEMLTEARSAASALAQQQAAARELERRLEVSEADRDRLARRVQAQDATQDQMRAALEAAQEGARSETQRAEALRRSLEEARLRAEAGADELLALRAGLVDGLLRTVEAGRPAQALDSVARLGTDPFASFCTAWLEAEAILVRAEAGDSGGESLFEALFRAHLQLRRAERLRAVAGITESDLELRLGELEASLATQAEPWLEGLAELWPAIEDEALTVEPGRAIAIGVWFDDGRLARLVKRVRSAVEPEPTGDAALAVPHLATWARLLTRDPHLVDEEDARVLREQAAAASR